MMAVTKTNDDTKSLASMDEVKYLLGHFWARSVGVDSMWDLYIHEENKPKVRSICQWLSGDSINGRYDIKKGLFVYGTYDNGKTELMRAIRMTAQYMARWHTNQVRPYEMAQYCDMKEHITKKKSLSLLTAHRRQDLYIDDIGYEESPANHEFYLNGSKRSIVVELTRKRETYHKHQGRLTHASSNHKIEQIEEIYGAGTASRWKRMCNLIRWHGDSITDILQQQKSISQ